MSFKKLLNTEIQQYINANLKVDLHSLLLKKSNFPEVSMQEIAQQIQGKKIAERKFPFLLKEGIIFAPHLNLEQSSSESTGNYKNAMLSGESFIDLTSGFGIDSYFISKNFKDITLVERNSDLLEIVQHNWGILNREATFHNMELESFLEHNSQRYDVVFLDPARRDAQKNKVFLLEDLSPNILAIQDDLLNLGRKVVIKLSPLIDISYLLSVLQNVTEIHIVAVKNDVKEILVIQEKESQVEEIMIKTVNLESEESNFEFGIKALEEASASFGCNEDYLYIPNNAILKSGAFNLISSYFNLKKLHPNSHFYTSNQLVESFPGRVLRVKSINAKEIKKGDKFNIIAKNYPLKPEEIKKKYKLIDGGDTYLIFTQDQKGKVILQSI